MDTLWRIKQLRRKLMLLYIGICDDEEVEINYLKTLVNNWANNGDFTVQIDTFESAENFLFKYDENKSFDILLLDIQMDKMDGVELAKQIRKDNEDMQIVFITGFPDFIAEGYEVSALHYLMKPVSCEKLNNVLDKAASRLQKSEKSLFLNIDGENVRIPLDDIVYCESFGHNVNLVTKENLFNIKISFTELKKQLDFSFIRCHRSYIVSIRHIKCITKTDVILDSGKAIPLSRRLYNETNQAFIKYFKGEL